MIAGALAISGVVLIVSGVVKLADPGPARAFIAASAPAASWLPPPLVGTCEIVLGTCAVVVGGRAIAALVALTYAGFAGLTLSLLRRKDRKPCGCFGRRSAPVSVRHLAVDIGLGVLAVAAVVWTSPPLVGLGGSPGVLPLLIVCGVSGGALLALAGMPSFPSFVGEHRTRREAVRLPQSWVDERIRVAGSRSRARGLVADARIEAGETVIVLAGRQVPSARPERVVGPRSVGRILRIEDGLHLVQGRDDPATRQRHSCDPTTWLDGAFCLVARRRIEAHEAVTVDLATLIADPAWHRTCHCHAPGCRGRLSGNDWMRPELQARYDGHFLPSIAARIGATARPAR